jgi:hypothetical protein
VLHLACTGEISEVYRILVGTPHGEVRIENKDIGGRIV